MLVVASLNQRILTSRERSTGKGKSGRRKRRQAAAAASIVSQLIKRGLKRHVSNNRSARSDTVSEYTQEPDLSGHQQIEMGTLTHLERDSRLFRSQQTTLRKKKAPTRLGMGTDNGCFVGCKPHRLSCSLSDKGLQEKQNTCKFFKEQMFLEHNEKKAKDANRIV